MTRPPVFFDASKRRSAILGHLGWILSVASTIVIDAQGNTNRFDFMTPHVNLNPAQTVFQWSPPAGTQIVRP